MSYSTDADVTPALLAGGIANPKRLARGSASGDWIELDQHGFDDLQAVTVDADEDYSVPGGLVAGTTYYVKAATSSRFQVSATAGGAAINLTSAGDNFTVWAELPIASWREWAARLIDSMLPVHVTPIVAIDGAYPPVVVQAEAELAAARGLYLRSGVDPGEKIDAIRVRLASWVKGLPLRGVAASTQSPVNLAITGSVTTDSRGWGRRGSDGSEVLP